MKLYGARLSGNVFKVELFLSLLGLEHEYVNVDLPSGEHRAESYLAINPRGQIPALADGDVTVWDSLAILVYLARRYADESWLPLAPLEMAEVMQWMAVSENELLFGLARARAALHFGRPWNLEQCQTYGRAGLGVMEERLADRAWLATAHPTIADLACYPYVALAPEGEISLDPYPKVRAWIAHVQALPGYVDMEGIERING